MTSAVITLRSRKIGRSRLKAIDMPTPKIDRKTTVASVSCQLSQNSTPIATPAVRKPPTSWISPVPTRLRMPSGSFITRLTSTPLLVLSKKRTGSRIR